MAKKRGQSALQPGMRIGYLELLEETNQWGKWNCCCGCGNIVVRDYSSLLRSKEKGALSSCGCLMQYRQLDAQIKQAREKQLKVTKELARLLDLKVMIEKQKASR
jgi:hypothetical protein